MLYVRGLTTLLSAGAVALAGGSALAWTIESGVSTGCHERLTRDALARAGYAGTDAPPAIAGDDATLAESLPFEVGDADRNIYALSLLLGSRFPDLWENAAIQDFSDLIEVHNADGMQVQHALRSASQDGDAGDDDAAAATIELVRSMIEEVLDTAGWEGTPDPEMRATVRVSLLYVGETDVSVSALYFAVGWALHVIQDSFAHCYRAGEELGQITEVMNWVELVSGELVVERDGQAHSSMLDDCACASPAVQDLVEAATKASADFLAAATLPMGEVERRLVLDEAFARWMTFAPGCTRETGFCGSPAWAEVEASGDACPEPGCSAAGGNPRGSQLDVAILAAIAGLAWSRRRRP
jgi:hypothetical protein